MKESPIFAFSKGFQPKKLEIKTYEDHDFDHLDICDELDDLISEFDNIDTPQNTSHFNKNIYNAEKIKEETNNNPKENSHLEIKVLQEKKNNNAYKQKENELKHIKSLENEICVDKVKNLGSENKERIDNTDMAIKLQENHKIFTNRKEDAESGKKLCDIQNFDLPKFQKIKFDFDLEVKNKDYLPSNEFERMKICLLNIEKSFNNSRSSIEQNKVELNDLQAEVKFYKQNICDLLIKQNEIYSESIKKSFINNKLDILKQKITNINTQIEALSQIVNTEIEKKIKQIEDLKEEIKITMVEKDEISQENLLINKTFQAEIDALNIELAQFSKKLIESETKNIVIQERNNELVKMVENLENVIENNNNKISDMEKMIEDLNNENKNLQKDAIDSIKSKERVDENIQDIINLNNCLKLEIINKDIMIGNIPRLTNDIISLNNKNEILCQENEKQKCCIEEFLEREEQTKLENILNVNDIRNRIIKCKNKIQMILAKIEDKTTGVRGAINVIGEFKAKNYPQNLLNYYNDIYAKESRKFKAEKSEYIERIDKLKNENEKIKRRKTSKNKYIEPDDSDLWNVFD